jgi:hypothetical protein
MHLSLPRFFTVLQCFLVHGIPPSKLSLKKNAEKLRNTHNQTQRMGSSPIQSFCWGKINLLGEQFVSDDSVKGAIVLERSKTGAWDWYDNAVKFGDMMTYHQVGIQRSEIQGFIDAEKPVVFLSAGVLGVLQLSKDARKALVDNQYDVIDLAEGNSDGERIGGDVFRDHCSDGNLSPANLSPKAAAAFSQIAEKVNAKEKVAVRAYTGDALIIFNELHAKHPEVTFVGLLHSNC